MKERKIYIFQFWLFDILHDVALVVIITLDAEQSTIREGTMNLLKFGKHLFGFVDFRCGIINLIIILGLLYLNTTYTCTYGSRLFKQIKYLV